MDDTSTLLTLGSFFLKNKNYTKAASVFRKCIEQSKHDFRGYFNLGLALTSIEDIDPQEQLQCFLEAIRLNPHIVEAYSAAAAVLIKLNNPSKAVDYCRKGLEVKANDCHCLYNMNIALRQMGKFVEALELTRNRLPSLPSPGEIRTCYDISRVCTETEVELCTTTIVMVKWGTKYGAEYVNALVLALYRFLTPENAQNTSIVCFTDTPEDEKLIRRPGVEYRLLPDIKSWGWRGWWCKAYLFSPEAALFGRVLYLDLDTVLCSQTVNALLSDPLAIEQKSGPHFICLGAKWLSNEGRPCGINSSVMIWRAPPVNSAHMPLQPAPFPHNLFYFLKSHYAEVSRVMYKFDHYLELMLSDAETGVMQDVAFVQDIYPGLAVDYSDAKAMATEGGDIPQPTGLVCFPLHPKPHHIRDVLWVKRHWICEPPL